MELIPPELVDASVDTMHTKVGAAGGRSRQAPMGRGRANVAKLGSSNRAPGTPALCLTTN